MPKYREIVRGKNGEDELRLNFHVGQDKIWNSKARFPVFLGGSQSGKALALGTLIPTVQGCKTMGELRVGDKVYGKDGKPKNVIYISPIFYGHDCYRLTFDDGSQVVADEDHLWRVQNRKQRKNMARRRLNPNPSWTCRWQCKRSADYQVLNTKQLFKSYDLGDNVKNYTVDISQPLEYPEAILPVPPYMLGAWLGDGTTDSAAITNSEPEIIDRIRQDWPVVIEHPHEKRATTYTFSKGSGKISLIAKSMKQIGVWQNKHIPMPYLTASIKQRQMLLQGLLDTNGYCSFNGIIEYTTISESLADDVLQLIRSLGIKARKGVGKATLRGEVVSDKYRITFQTTMPVFSLRRKLSRQCEPRTLEYKRLFISNIEHVESVPTKCIEVDSNDHLYLVGSSYIPTHNTTLSADWMEREIRQRGPGDYLAITATFPLMNLKLLPEFRYVFESLYRYGEYKQQRGSHLIAFHRNENKGKVLFSDEEYEKEGVQETRIIFGSATNSESIESATAKAAVLDEVGQKTWKRDAWEATLRRLSLAQGRALLITSLYGYGWLKTEVYDQWLNGNADFDVVQIDSITNPAFPREEYERAKRSMPAWKFDLFYRGRFSKPAGMVYDCLEEDNIVDDFPIPETWLWYTGHDFGTNNMSGVWVCQNPGTGEFYIAKEYLAGGLATFEHVAKWKQLSAGLRIVKRAGGSPGEDGWRGDFTQAGWQISKPIVSSVEEGIQKVYGLLKTKRLKIFRSCIGVQDDFYSYSYELDENYNPTDQIVNKERYHFCDSVRYVCADFHPVEIGEIGEQRWDDYTRDDYTEDRRHGRRHYEYTGR